MQNNFNLLSVQNAIGYTFKNAELIKTAFVHKSYEKANAENNTRQVFLGEKLLSLLICDYVCTHSSAKGEKQLISDFSGYLKALAPEKFIKKNSLTKFVTLSTLNEPLRGSDALCRELFYAIVAAIYKDGGLPALKGFLMPMLRGIGDKEHYEPSIEGKVESRADAVLSSEKHISNSKIRLGAKPTTISVGKAKTVDVSEKEAEAVTPEPNQKRFIRDPFAPVKLSDDLRNFKPKKQPKEQAVQASEAPATRTSDAVLDDNHKSLLQETIQKNIRSASVLIKYDSKPISKNEWVSTVTLSDKVIGVGNGENKKSAEKAAAGAAYIAIKTNGTSENRFFSSLCSGDIADTAIAVDYVSKINQYFQKTKRLSSAPVTYEKRHSGQKNLYMLAVIFEGREIAAGKGANLKEAKQNAAKVACEVLNIK